MIVCEDGLRCKTVELENERVSIKLSKVWSLDNPSLPPAAVVEITDKELTWKCERLDLERYEDLAIIQVAMEKLDEDKSY
jgi:hypothetical protein